MLLLLILPPDMVDPTFNSIHITVKKMMRPFDLNMRVPEYKHYLWQEKNVVEKVWADLKSHEDFLRDYEGIYIMSTNNPNGHWSSWGYGGGGSLMPLTDYEKCRDAKKRERAHNWETRQPNIIKDLAAVLLPCNLFPITTTSFTFKPDAVLTPDDTWYDLKKVEIKDFHTGLQSRLPDFTGSQVVTIDYSSYVESDL